MHYIDSPIKFCCRYILENDTPIYSSSQDFGKGEGGAGGGGAERRGAGGGGGGGKRSLKLLKAAKLN